MSSNAVNLIKDGVLYINNNKLVKASDFPADKLEFDSPLKYKNQTIAYKILNAHNANKSDESKLKIKFDCLASHDITYVGIIQTARASGIDKFPVPYVLTNCHNSLCAVGGTINEDDHVFGLSAAEKYGGIFVPAHLAVIHTYMREMTAKCGNMILGSDSHTRYGALGTLAVGEGGPEIVKQLLGRTYDINAPEVIAVYLTGSVKKGVGPQDVALKIIGEVFRNGFVKNKILEFIGDGIKNLPVEFRNGIDVMTTETTCLSSIWTTDEKVENYYETHGRKEDYRELKPGDIAYYDGAVTVDLSKIECMIAMPFHPSNTYTVNEVNQNLDDIINKIEADGKKIAGEKYNLRDKIINGGFKTDQGIIGGCAGGTFDSICAAADILKNKSIGAGEFSLSVYPGSQPINLELTRNGAAAELIKSGVIMRSAFCGPCFGAGDVPANNAFSIRHSTRNFPNREGSKPSDNQISSVALMDALSIAATAVNGGYLTAATDLDLEFNKYKFNFDSEVYKNRVYFGYGKADAKKDLKYGPNIAGWPEFKSLGENIILKVCSVITDEVTTTDELIPSGETSSYRSNPYRLAEFTLSRKDPEYVNRAKNRDGFDKFKLNLDNTDFGSVIFANKPGDGSAREQAASCQRVLGGLANIAREYATKRYRSNLINWGMIPFIYDKKDLPFENGDYIFIPGIKQAIINKTDFIDAYIYRDDNINQIALQIPELTNGERDIILAGCLINYYKNK
ncbi:MAG: hydratase [Oscillospiraceae bacterium]|nr:hydratase [Oscillospiraceae bacterium]